MNILQAKTEIINTIRAYRTKDEFGNPVIVKQRQRPIFLLGVPGVGKTDIVQQVADELQLPLVSYSMTHHTRQSALGLPYIKEEEFDGKTYRMTEYTMSEIIASIYHKMEKTGEKEGILFLDEINCVSETLAPAMLQFLQYKKFGEHEVPEGWIIVTAGNPIEFNKSVKEFDIATMDRLKRIEVEADYGVWRDYAVNARVHQAIVGYLDSYPGDFLSIETTVDGKHFATPRGWMDMSDILRLYEKNDIPATYDLMIQYIQSPAIARRFCTYYDLFIKYRRRYAVSDILDGKANASVLEKAAKAKTDEKLSLTALLFESLMECVDPVVEKHACLQSVNASIRDIRVAAVTSHRSVAALIKDETDRLNKQLQKGLDGNMLSPENGDTLRRELAFYAEVLPEAELAASEKAASEALKAAYDVEKLKLKKQAEAARQRCTNVIRFVSDAFGKGGELSVLITDLTAASNAARFMQAYGCDEYYQFVNDMLISTRQMEIMKKLETLE